MKQLLRMAILLTLLAVAFGQAQVPTRGLVGYWPFDGDAFDHSGNGNNGAIVNAVAASDHLGNPGGALHLNGTDAYVRVENSPSLQGITDSITVAGWFRITTWTDGLAPFCAKNDAPGTPQYGIVVNSGPDQVSFHFDDGTNNQVLGNYNRDFNLNQWYFIAVTWDGQLFRFYMDFNLLDSVFASPEIIGNTQPLEFGRDTGGLTDYLNGDLDELRIYNRALSIAEIHQLYAEQSSPSLPRYFAGTGHWYQLIPNVVCWDEARDSAIARGGYLATILDATEEDFVRNLLVPVPMAAWLGGYDPNGDGTWKWVTGETFYSGGQCQAYCNWAPSEPSHTGIEDRLTIIADPPAHPSYWNNVVNCGVPQSFPYLVEWDDNPAADILRIGKSQECQVALNASYSIPIYLDNADTVKAFDVPLDYSWGVDPDSVSFIGTRLAGKNGTFTKLISIGGDSIRIGYISLTGNPSDNLEPVNASTQSIPIARIFMPKCIRQYFSAPDTATIPLPVNPISVELTDKSGARYVPLVLFDSSWVRSYVLGDANSDSLCTISDPVFVINYIFAGGSAPVCLLAADADCNGIVTISDPVYVINYIFAGGPVPGANCLCGAPPMIAKSTTGHANISTASSQGKVAVACDASSAIRALQLDFTISGEVRNIQVKSNVDQLQLFAGVVESGYRLGLIDLTGTAAIAAGRTELLSVTYEGTGELAIASATVVDNAAEEMNVAIGTSKLESNLPEQYSLSQNQPNPFNPSTDISFSLPKADRVRLIVYNILGEEIVVLVDAAKPAGTHTVTWDGKDKSGHSVASGVYLYRLVSPEFSATRKMLLLK